MASKVVFTLVTLLCLSVRFSQQNVENNEVDEVNPLAEAAAAILKEQSAENIGGMVSNLLQSGGAKQIGDMLLSGNTGQQLMQGLGSLMTQQNFDPSVIGSMVMGMMQGGQNGEGFDGGAFVSMLGGLLGGEEKKTPMDYFPMLVQTISSFVGPEAEARAKSHQDHAWFIPPVLEKIHVFIDNFMHSDMGRQFINTVGAEKFVKIFSDDQGKLSYGKFVDMLENHSFRRHWISMVTNRIAALLTHLAEPKIQKKYLTTVQAFVNSVLKTQGFPKATLLDFHRPVDSISSLVNYGVKFYFNVPFSSRQYVKPAVEYVQESLKLAQKKGMFSGDSRQLSDKLADTINMEVIEPIARVNRAYRFAKKVTECDQYVMCLVNQDARSPDPNVSLPGLKTLLSKSTSIILSWFLSTHTGTPFWNLYTVIIEDSNCQARFLEKCQDFHIEEAKVTSEYVHNEL